MPGSLSNPYNEDMFQLIVEVGWSALADIGILSWWSEGTGHIYMGGRIQNSPFVDRWADPWNGFIGPFINGFSALIPGDPSLYQNLGIPVDPIELQNSDDWLDVSEDLSFEIPAQEQLPVIGGSTADDGWEQIFMVWVAGAMTPGDADPLRQNLLINYKLLRETVNPTDPVPFTVNLQLAGLVRTLSSAAPTYWQMKHYKIPEVGDVSFALDPSTKEVSLTGTSPNFTESGEVTQGITTTLQIADNMFREVSGT